MIYFASDAHLGLKFNEINEIEREKKFASWLDHIEPTCDELFLVGDIFDFWFEWNRCVPKGYTRVLGTLARMCDRGVKIHFFTGNHDLWLSSYLQDDIGMEIHRQPLTIQRQGKRLFIAHGDTFCPKKAVSRVIEKVLRSESMRWVSQRVIHPDSMIRFGMNWSRSNRLKRGGIAHIFGGDDDFLVKFSRRYLSLNPDIDYFIFGHLHTPVMFSLCDKSTMVVLGEWVDTPIYGQMDGGVVTLHEY